MQKTIPILLAIGLILAVSGCVGQGAGLDQSTCLELNEEDLFATANDQCLPYQKASCMALEQDTDVMTCISLLAWQYTDGSICESIAGLKDRLDPAYTESILASGYDDMVWYCKATASNDVSHCGSIQHVDELRELCYEIFG